MKMQSLAVSAANAQSIRAASGSSPHQVRQQDLFDPSGSKKSADVKGSGAEDNKVSPEEILDKIKQISEDGLYSVRFEKNEEIDELVVKLVDRQTDEVIRQIPPEAILGIKANLREYAGNIVNRVS
jgi:flagellar protein FlaG